MQDLTDADKGETDLIELAETTTAREAVGSDEVAVEDGAEGAEKAPVAVTGNNEGALIDTIQVRTSISRAS